MKKIIKTILVSVVLLSVVGALTSCGKRVEDEEAIEIVAELVSRSYELNVAYYGKGLEANPEEQIDESAYYAVVEDAPYRTKTDMINDTRSVFSDRIASDLITIYFDGTQSMGVAILARYITGYDGYLTVLKDYDYIVDEVYKYDTSTVEITKNKRNEIRASVTTSDGKHTTEVVCIWENDGWRIDSPTY